MGIGRYLLHDFHTARELNQLEQKRRRASRRQRKRRSRMRQEREDLKRDLEAVSLLAFSLAELGVRKGLYSPQELRSLIDELDQHDGQADRRLPVSTLLAAMAEGAAAEVTVEAGSGERPA